MEKTKRWFKFFYIYKGAFLELSPRNCKKLIIALCEYAENESVKIKLNKKTLTYFEQICTIFDADKEFCKKNGHKGAKKRWNFDTK